jgi:hypothetical protein
LFKTLDLVSPSNVAAAHICEVTAQYICALRLSASQGTNR